jgi:hypothetical protein
MKNADETGKNTKEKWKAILKRILRKDSERV